MNAMVYSSELEQSKRSMCVHSGLTAGMREMIHELLRGEYGCDIIDVVRGRGDGLAG
jgi:hypothetical protein